MKFPFFGRKPAPQPPAPAQKRDEDRGHQAVLAQLREKESTEPEIRQQVAAGVVFGLVLEAIADKRGVRIENLLAILAAIGGHACLLGAFAILQRSGGKSEGGQLVTIKTKDGKQYYFGDLPNKLLLESPTSLLSLALGAAQASGADVSSEKIEDVIRHCASTLGSPDFGIPRLDPPNRPDSLPFDFVKHLAPKIFATLDQYEVPVEKRATALGFALQRAIDAGKGVLDPTISVNIILEYAVPAAKFDPAEFG